MTTPISLVEFAKFFRNCIPPTGWSKTISIANSGGPDSICLLFLINSFLKEAVGEVDLPQKVISLSVDHKLQESSSTMAEQAGDAARQLGIEHHTLPVPWSTPPFPPAPIGKSTLELTARLARFHVLFEAMKRKGSSVLALGHHADDQVETSLQRLAKGTTEIGAGGMRRCRRWGMGYGSASSIGWAGHEGLSRWMIRPLLPVGKDRILATCEENNLSYVTDSTNFQPALTLRNAIRHVIKEQPEDLKAFAETLPLHIRESLLKIEQRSNSLETVSLDLTGGVGQLRAAVSALSRRVDDVDNEVDTYIKNIGLPAPPGTFIISHPAALQITDRALRGRIVQRIMRYVSFHPWGTIRADGNRRSHSLNQIIDRVWHPQPHSQAIFVAGGGVAWIPAWLRTGGTGDQRINYFRRHQPAHGPGTPVWIAGRQPPLSKEKLEVLGMEYTLRVNLTQDVMDGLARLEKDPNAPQTIEVLYDCRFLVTIDLKKIPEDILDTLRRSHNTRLLLIPHTRWFWPKVILRSPQGDLTLDSSIPEIDTILLKKWTTHFDRSGTPIVSDWVRIKWIRPLDAI